MAEARKYTREEANRVLGEVRIRLQELQDAYQVMQNFNENLKRASESNGSQRAGGELEGAAATVAGLLSWFEEREIIVRDIPQGLIDFPGDRNGEDILLCWKAPEPAVDFWHYPDTGYAGRQPL